jgi:hypothetical protein
MYSLAHQELMSFKFFLNMPFTRSLTAHLMLLISLQSYKLAPPPKKDNIIQI